MNQIAKFIEEGQNNENGPISQTHWDQGLRRRGMEGVGRRLSGLCVKKDAQNRVGCCKRIVGVDFKALRKKAGVKG